MTEPERLGLLVLKVLWENEPQLVGTHPEAVAKSISAVSQVLGSLLGSVCIQHGLGEYKSAKAAAYQKVEDAAYKTAEIALTQPETSTAVQ